MHARSIGECDWQRGCRYCWPATTRRPGASGRSLPWLRQHAVLLLHLPGARGVGFESDAAVFRLTRHNIAALALPIDILNTGYLTGLAGISVGLDELLILFIVPPWGDAFHRTSGVDLRRTTPPIAEIVDFLLYRFSQNQLLCAIQVYEVVLPVSMAELRSRFDWSILRIFELNTRRGRTMEFFSVPRAGYRRLSSLNTIAESFIF
jgi:hypothetical protein